MSATKHRLLSVVLCALTTLPALAQSPGGALTLLKISGDLKIIDSGSLIFNDNTVQATAGIVGVSPGAGVTVTGSGTVTVGVDPAQVQTRVTSTCSSGISGIDQDGGVTCASVGHVVVATADATLTAPAGAGHALVEVWGGGGGGASKFSPVGGGGGGAGGYLRAFVTVQAGDVVTLSVGIAGSAGTGGDGGDGGNSSVLVNSVAAVTAQGGVGGAQGGVGGAGGGVQTAAGTFVLQSGTGGTGTPGTSGPTGGQAGVPAFGARVVAAGGAGQGSAAPVAGGPGLILITFEP